MRKRPRNVLIGVGVVAGLAAGALFLTEPGRAIRDLWGTGAVQAAMSEQEMRTYHATTEGNLRAIYNAIKIYEESEGGFPDAPQWMDRIASRMTTSDMTEEEAAKKLVAPSLAGQADAFGYAMNEAASSKYSGDLDAGMPLIFDSSDTVRNAHGTPEVLLPKPPRAGQNMGISVDGTLLKLP